MALEDEVKLLTKRAERVGSYLERIALALEGLLESNGQVPKAPAEPEQLDIEDADEPDDLDMGDEPKKKASKKKASKKKASKKKVSKKKASKKKAADAPDKAAVRAKLMELREAISPKAVPALLKDYGASTLGQLDEKHYADVIAQVDAELEEIE